MQPYWVTFTDGSPSVCVEGKSKEDAMQIATIETGKHIKSLDILPYPARPRIGLQSDCPDFCFSPERCKDHTSCPRSYACSE